MVLEFSRTAGCQASDRMSSFRWVGLRRRCSRCADDGQECLSDGTGMKRQAAAEVMQRGGLGLWARGEASVGRGWDDGYGVGERGECEVESTASW